MMPQFFFRSLSMAIGAVIALGANGAAPPRAQSASWDSSQGMLLEGVVVTMNDARDVLRHGRVLIRDGRIVAVWDGPIDRKSTRLNSSHLGISYAVFCLKKK